MYILGISCFYHESAAALLKDGQVIAASAEERFSRKKHDSDFPIRAIDFCLKKASILAADLDYVVFYEKPFWKFVRILLTTLASYPQAYRLFAKAMITWLADKLWVRSIIAEEIDIDRQKILFVPHHISHAASAFYASGFTTSAILTFDGVGEWTTPKKLNSLIPWDFCIRFLRPSWGLRSTMVNTKLWAWHLMVSPNTWIKSRNWCEILPMVHFR